MKLPAALRQAALTSEAAGGAAARRRTILDGVQSDYTRLLGEISGDDDVRQRDKLRTIATWYVEQTAYLVSKLKQASLCSTSSTSPKRLLAIRVCVAGLCPVCSDFAAAR